MVTVSDILKQAAERGVQLSERTFWKYHGLGLLPAGKKVPGRGNVTYFPDDTPIVLLLIHFLAAKLNIGPSELRSYSWLQSQLGSEFWALPDLSNPQIAVAKDEYEKAKGKALHQFLKRVEELLKSEGARHDKDRHVWNNTSPRKEVHNQWKPPSGPLESED